MTLRIVLVYLLIINLDGFRLMGKDKRRALEEGFRVPERMLFLRAILGGTIGCLIGMYFFHHKTRKPAFRFGMPLILVAQIVLLIVAFLRWDLASFLFAP